MTKQLTFYPGRLIVLWGLFFLICFGLGYSTLNRYDPRTVGNIDSREYYKLVTGGPRDAVGHWRYRVLVPYLAKPFYWLAEGRIGTWDPVFLGLLIVNAALCATSACLLAILGHQVLGDYTTALLGASLYLLNFTITNGQLAGLVDSAEGCLMLVLIWAMLSRRWWLLPILGVLGALAKETFVPLSGVFALAWWLATARHDTFRLRRGIWIVAMGISGLATITLVQSLVSGYVIWPWDVVLGERRLTNLLSGLLECIWSQSFWYVFIWLLPLGVWRLGTLPRSWTFASLAAVIAALMLGAWNRAGGNVARALFSVAGPALSLSTAALIASDRQGFFTTDLQRELETQSRTETFRI